MKNFAALYTELDQTTKTLEKIQALSDYFARASDGDKLWTIALLSHRRPRRTISAALLGTWAAERAGLPLWLFEESYHIVGDLAETITLVLPKPEEQSDDTLTYWIGFIKALEPLTIDEKKEKITWAWQRLPPQQRFVFNKLITGSFRVGVSQQLMVKALAKTESLAENILAHRLMGKWSPENTTLKQLLQDEVGEDISKPYPFYLAYALEEDVAALGEPAEWFAERKWDGIRGQIIVRKRELFVWSRGEELVTDKYPEYEVMLNYLPDGTVIDGEIMPFRDGQPLSFNHLQTRIGRKNLSPKILKEVPVAFIVYDLLEWEGKDIRDWPMAARRQKLEAICPPASEVLRLSALVPFEAWPQLAAERARSRALHSEGIMLKRKQSPYRDGRRRGDWWKWKIDPYTVDAVMIYAMSGHGRRANLYTDYTFAVWDGDQLVPFAKAYSGLTDDEIRDVDRWVKQHTLERFGPVRSVNPELVFEIAFEGIAKSTRHKSGVALRFPRILRWRKDKPASEADTMDYLRKLLEQPGTLRPV